MRPPRAPAARWRSCSLEGLLARLRARTPARAARSRGVIQNHLPTAARVDESRGA
jgi:hypothetical protein